MITRIFIHISLFFIFTFSFHLPAKNIIDSVIETRPLDMAPVHVFGNEQGPLVREFIRDDVSVSVFGEIRPVNKNIDFYTARIERQIASSKIILGNRGVVIGEGIGLLKGITLWRSISKTKFIGNKKNLSDIVPDEDYSLWKKLKIKYMDNDSNVEKLKPMYAAWKLYEAALKYNHMDMNVPSVDLIRRTKKSNKIPFLDVRYRLKISAPKIAIREFSVNENDDLECFQKTIHHLEKTLIHLPEIGQAWAHGNIRTLSELIDSTPVLSPCWGYLTNAAIAKQQGIDLEQSMDEAWLTGLRDAASKYKMIFATVPIHDLIHSQGAVRLLLNEGFLPKTIPEEEDSPEFIQNIAP